MNESGFITLIGILIAVYPLLPKIKKLEIKLYVNKIDYLVLFSCFLAIHFIIFYDYFKTLGVQSPEFLLRYNLNRNHFIYLIFLSLAVYLFLRSKFAYISRSNIKNANSLFEELLNQRKYYDALDLFKNHFERLRNIEKNPCFRNKIAKIIAPKNKFQLLMKDEKPGYLDRNIPNVLEKISNLVAKHDLGQEYATNILNRFFSNDEMINYITINHPYEALSFMRSKNHRLEYFLEQYFSILIDNQNSVFYFELDNIYSSEPCRIQLIESSKLLYYFFYDVHKSEELKVYKHVGNKLISILDHDNNLISKYNESSDIYMKLNRGKCPIALGINFFDILIIESMHKGIKWHMWLLYLPTFTRKILANLNPDENVDFEDEYPTPFHYLLYHIIIVMLNWYEAFEYVEDKESISYKNESLKPEYKSIVKSNLLALGNVIYMIISSNKLNRNFKVYILEVILRHISNKSHLDDYQKINKLLLMSIVNNGNHETNDQRYRDLLSEIIEDPEFYAIECIEDFKKTISGIL